MSDETLQALARSRLTESQTRFFDELKTVCDITPHFYGSILRPDYMAGRSDVDVDLFTDNERSTVAKLSAWLQLKRSDWHRAVYKIRHRVVTGWKTKYQNEDRGVDVELSVYDNRIRSHVEWDHALCEHLPPHITVALVVLKFFYYVLGVVPIWVYRRAKQFLMNANDEFKFILLDE